MYVMIDKAPESLASENNKVIRCAESFNEKLNLIIRVNEVQAGVKLGVPRAIDWVLNLENQCIILEDDCDLSSNTLSYFDQMSIYIGGDIALISGDSPWKKDEVEHSSLSQYPLIWGLATNREQWKKLRVLIDGEIPWMRVLQTAARNPRNILSVSYFLSAQIRVKRGLFQAWDCSVALNMLLTNLKCIIPNVRIVDNVGNDEFAHHTLQNLGHVNRKIEELTTASTSLRNDPCSQKAVNKAIRKRIYKMRIRHFFSPVKVLFSKSSS